MPRGKNTSKSTGHTKESVDWQTVHLSDDDRETIKQLVKGDPVSLIRDFVVLVTKHASVVQKRDPDRIYDCILFFTHDDSRGVSGKRAITVSANDEITFMAVALLKYDLAIQQLLQPNTIETNPEFDFD